MAHELETLPFDVPEGQESARAYLTRHLGEARLVDLLLLPILFYGSPTPSDVDFPSFLVLWKSLYEEGFARPAGGIRPLLDALRARYLELGGELRMKAGVAEILHENGRTQGVRLDDGTEILSERVISSAGRVETLSLCGETLASTYGPEHAGRMTFVESTTLLDQPAPDLGWTDTIVFFSQGEHAIYEEPQEAVSFASGVICCPENYADQVPESEGVLRLTLMANAERWKAMTDEEYVAAKEQAWAKGLETVSLYGPDVREQVVAKDAFTPRTIEHFTGHHNGAVYGCPHKDKSGTTPLEGLFLCGTDQGYLGIIGAMLSGVAMANRHALLPA
jgi:phytoene dehydrogenase-like protein